MTTVSVIVPAHNAGATLAATLHSASAQTHREIEIIVVDDGSSDDTRAVAEECAAGDARIRTFSVPHGGVSAARNHALAAARGAFIAPLDADDLWHPQKLALQLAVLRQAGERAILAYNWFVAIDGADQPLLRARMPQVEGPVFYRHLDYNFISNGSSVLVRSDAMRAVGYDTALTHCEDYKLQLDLALRGRFVCVPAFLTGYRKIGRGLSSDSRRMLAAHIAVLNAMRSPGRPAADPIIDRRIAEFEVELARNRLRRGEFADGLGALAGGFARAPVAAGRHLASQARRLFTQDEAPRPAAHVPAERFPFADPFAAVGYPLPSRRLRRLAPLAALDRRADYLV